MSNDSRASKIVKRRAVIVAENIEQIAASNPALRVILDNMTLSEIQSMIEEMMGSIVKANGDIRRARRG